MKTAIVYYSYTGTTKKYVEKMQELLSCELIEIKPVKDIKVKGFVSYFVGGLKIAAKETPELQPYVFDADDYDSLILATPVWAYTYAPALRSFLEKERLSKKKISLFMTHKGGPREAMVKFEKALEGNEILGTLELNAKDKEAENMQKVETWIQKELFPLFFA